MARLNENELRTRLAYDFKIITESVSKVDYITVEAYSNHRDAKSRQNPITDPAEGEKATHYVVVYRISTLSGAGKFMDETVIHMDLLANGNYPFQPPASWVVSQPMPWSPHFKAGTVVCIGDLWNGNGTTLLINLIRHHARLLNWHEVARGGGYRGWNGEAIDWHKANYGTKPLNENMIYPEIPSGSGYGLDDPENFMRIGGRRRRGGPAPVAENDPGLFAGNGGRR